jgi:hypothetical protein
MTTETRNTVLRGAAIHNELMKDTSLTSHDSGIPKLRLTTTPPWLKNPTMKAANATTRLHHIDKKNSQNTCAGRWVAVKYHGQ